MLELWLLVYLCVAAVCRHRKKGNTCAKGVDALQKPGDDNFDPYHAMNFAQNTQMDGLAKMSAMNDDG